MKMRWMMAIIAVLAVLTWLAVPAVLIWRDPSLTKAVHTFRGTKECATFLDQNRFAKGLGVLKVEFDSIGFTHERTFGEAYREILWHGRSWLAARCSDHATNVVSFEKCTTMYQGGRYALPPEVVSQQPSPEKSILRPFWLKSPALSTDESDTSR